MGTESIEGGNFGSFVLQIGEDERAEELTISLKLGEWGFYLREKETGEIFHVTGDDGGRETADGSDKRAGIRIFG